MPQATQPPSAPQFFARLSSLQCTGDYQCHWCGSPCGRQWLHDEPPALIGHRVKFFPRLPASPYVCAGCWYWRRPRVTVYHLGGSYQDGRCLLRESVLMTEGGIHGLRLPSEIDRGDAEALHAHLLKPPHGSWVLSFIEGQQSNLPHLMRVNDVPDPRAGTRLFFTLNNIVHDYTPHGLELALRHPDSVEAPSPGTAALIRLLGPYRLPEWGAENGKRKAGRKSTAVEPADNKVLLQPVLSGR